MKKTLLLVLGFLLICVNVYAAGDLIVNGNLGAGTSTLNAKVNAESTDISVLDIKGIKSADASFFNGSVIRVDGNSSSNVSAIGLVVLPTSSTTGATSGGLRGSVYKTKFTGSGSVDTAIGFSNQVHLASFAGPYTIGRAEGTEVVLWEAGDQNHTITDFYGLHSWGLAAGSGALSGTNWRHAYFEDFPAYGAGSSVANVSGLWIDQQTRGTNNYGIVLNGDDAGSDIVFGPTQSERIYSSAGRLYAQDSFGNQTILSPHDPETGEWIYYSKNTKTGIVKRVNMEKLVKAIEKLTGETFMVETLIEDK